MIEIRLLGVTFGTAPLDKGGKQLVFKEGDTTYLIPLGEDAVKRVINELSKSNDELQKIIDEQPAKQD